MSKMFSKEVQPLFEQYRAEWLAKARHEALKLGRKRRVVTVDDVRNVCPPPEEFDPRVMGAVFRTPEWEAVGFINSGRRACHKRPVRLFALRDTLEVA